MLRRSGQGRDMRNRVLAHLGAAQLVGKAAPAIFKAQERLDALGVAVGTKVVLRGLNPVERRLRAQHERTGSHFVKLVHGALAKLTFSLGLFMLRQQERRLQRGGFFSGVKEACK